MHVWAYHQTETWGNRASIMSLNAIRPCLLFRAELWMWGNAHLLHQSYTHTQEWQLFNSETPLTFSSCCRCGSSHLKPRCSSSRPRGMLRPLNSATRANGIYFSPMSCAANNRQATVTGSVVSGESARCLPRRSNCF